MWEVNNEMIGTTGTSGVKEASWQVPQVYPRKWHCRSTMEAKGTAMPVVAGRHPETGTGQAESGIDKTWAVLDLKPAPKALAEELWVQKHRQPQGWSK